MLVLSRKTNESIIVADNIKITIVNIKGNKVKIGIEAPPEISIARQELLFEMQAEHEVPHTIELTSNSLKHLAAEVCARNTPASA